MLVRNCNSCGEEISAKRLAARPSATLCFACQTKTEDTQTPVAPPRAYVHPAAAMMHSMNRGVGIFIDSVNDAYEKTKDRE